MIKNTLKRRMGNKEGKSKTHQELRDPGEQTAG